jgi:hypothetical protein
LLGGRDVMSFEVFDSLQWVETREKLLLGLSASRLSRRH